MKNDKSAAKITVSESAGYIAYKQYTVFTGEYETVEVEDFAGRAPESLQMYIDLGWENITVRETGERFNRKYRISGTLTRPVAKTFNRYAEAAEYKKSLQPA